MIRTPFHNNKYMNNTPMLDLFFNMVLLFFVTTVLNALMIKIDQNKKNVETKADFLITASWPTDVLDDVDLYCMDPLENIVFFQSKTAGLMQLERDDLGMSNDEIILPDGTTYNYKINEEKITLRSFIKGEYIVNVHMYLRSRAHNNQCKVTVKIEKLNPYSIVLIKDVVLERNGDEATICRFKVNKDGKVTEINYLPKKFAVASAIPEYEDI